MNIHPLDSIEATTTEQNDTPTLAQTKVDPFQDPNYQPPLPGEPKIDTPQITPLPVGQGDSLTDQPRQGVSNEEQMAPARYIPQNPDSLEQDSDLDDSALGEDPAPINHGSSTEVASPFHQREQ